MSSLHFVFWPDRCSERILTAKSWNDSNQCNTIVITLEQSESRRVCRVQHFEQLLESSRRGCEVFSIRPPARSQKYFQLLAELTASKRILIIDSMKSFLCFLTSSALYNSLFDYYSIPNMDCKKSSKSDHSREKWSMADWFLMIDLLSLGNDFGDEWSSR